MKMQKNNGDDIKLQTRQPTTQLSCALALLPIALLIIAKETTLVIKTDSPMEATSDIRKIASLFIMLIRTEVSYTYKSKKTSVGHLFSLKTMPVSG